MFSIFSLSLMLLCLTACEEKQPKTQIPVKVFKGMLLGSLLNEPVGTSNVAELKKILNNKWYAAIDVMTLKDSSETYSISGCSEYFKHQDKGITPVRENEISAFSEFVLMCKAANDIVAAAPATNSFLVDLQFDKDLPNKLPKQLAMIISTTESKKIMADKLIKTWGEVNKISGVEVIEKYLALYHHAGANQEIELLATGDFNNDGVDDALISLRDSVEEGSYSALRIYSLTKTASDGLYEVSKEYSY